MQFYKFLYAELLWNEDIKSPIDNNRVVSPHGKSNWVFPLYLIWIESCFWMPYKSLTSLAKSITLELWYLLMRLRVVVIISKRVSWYSVCEKSWDSS